MTCGRFSISRRQTLQVDLPSTNGLGGRNKIMQPERGVFDMKLNGIVIGVNADGKEVRRHINRDIKKIPKDGDFSAFQIGTGITVEYVKATVTDNGKLIRLYSTI